MNSPHESFAPSSQKPVRLAACITAHGFGHSTRSIAILQAAQRKCPHLELLLFTTAPAHLFRESLKNFTIIPIENDVGLIQRDALTADLPATIKALDRLFPLSPQHIHSVAEKLAGCSAVLSDISPLGIVSASAANIPSVLVENFTWDWIYEPFAASFPEIVPHIETLRSIYTKATHHIQTEPVCVQTSTAQRCGPIFRFSSASPAQIKANIKEEFCVGDRHLILVSMGGFNFSLSLWTEIFERKDYFFLLAGQPEQKRIAGNVMSLCHDSGYYHPDLIAAADLVICKSGYSTIAECFQAGTRVIGIDRPFFAESAILANFVTTTLKGKVINDTDFIEGRWLNLIDNSVKEPRPRPAENNCADQVADILLNYCR